MDGGAMTQCINPKRSSRPLLGWARLALSGLCGGPYAGLRRQ